MPTGRFIALEGIDGSGKRTQLDLLADALEKRGVPCVRVGFPRYSSVFGTLVGRYLNGEFGRLEQVDAHLSALLYAGDRFEAKGELLQHLQRGRMVLADRYIGSNLAHQSARLPPQKRDNFVAWLRRLEYGVYGLPEEDLVVYLRVPPEEAQRLVSRKGEREYTEKKYDIQEADLEHLRAAAAMYDLLTQSPNWTLVECWDAAAQQMRAPQAIHEDVLAVMQARGLLR